MNEIQFAHPEFAQALWGVGGVAALLVLLEVRGGQALERFIAPDTQRHLVSRPTESRRWASLTLLILALVAIVIALMRPQWGVEYVQSPQVGAEIMIALDVSRSMLAEDVAPNRLERAKAEIRDLLPYLKGDQVGLIAFAGRASVLCPLTPDFGFLRLVLDHIDVGSVAVGGTRLEEPIRKATDGFGSIGDLARVLLFFTDGEDHDSFPLDAAKEAAERGIRIVIIGFGDEAGSDIWVTDPTTGARTRVLDQDGHAAVSRLDGELLRELALVTEGAYVPAGTGVLDLESIFEAHLRPLMRGEGELAGRTIQKDGFGWALLVALIALLGHLVVGQRRRWPSTGLALALLLLPLQDASAQQAPPGPEPAESQPLAADPEKASPSSVQPRLELPEVPREAYNQGVAALEKGDLDSAEQLFEAARRSARGDGTLRFQASYNQSWVEVERADSMLKDDPAASLASLERAGDWLREAIAVRPENEAARVNLEIVLQRALQLSDALAEKDPPDIAKKLDALIEAQRSATRTIRAVASQVEQSPGIDPDEAARARFRGVAVEQRAILTDAEQLAQSVGDELSRMKQKPEPERTPEERMQTAGLEELLYYLHRGRERMGQARVQLRRRQATRAHRRAAVGLSELKRAREQLLGPVQLIEGLTQDTGQLAEETARRVSSTLEFAPSPDAPRPEAPPLPSWLDLEYLTEAAQGVAERTAELNAKLSAGIGQADEAADPEQAKALETLRAAQPHIERAGEHLADSADALASEEPNSALQDQMAAFAALMEAREQFLDLKGLIETAWADELRIGGLLEREEAASLREFAEALASLQDRNLERVERMTGLIEEDRDRLVSLPSEASADASQDVEAEKERLELADGILALVESAMRGASESLRDLSLSEAAVEPARKRVATAVKGLEGLRRLFFSIIEHLRDVARQQSRLGDETEEMAGRPVQDRTLGPLEEHQQQLSERAEPLAETLHEQSFAQPEELVGAQAAQDPAAAQEAAERLARASELVLLASQDMLAAADGLERGQQSEPSPPDSPPAEDDLEPVRTQQDAALDKLAKALAILEPPQEEPGDASESESGQEPSEQPSGSEPEKDREEDDPTARDPNQLLQAVRDREAERHRTKHDSKQSGYSPVEKDW